MGGWGGCGEEEIFGPAAYLTPRSCDPTLVGVKPFSPERFNRRIKDDESYLGLMREA